MRVCRVLRPCNHVRRRGGEEVDVDQAGSGMDQSHPTGAAACGSTCMDRRRGVGSMPGMDVRLCHGSSHLHSHQGTGRTSVRSIRNHALGNRTQKADGVGIQAGVRQNALPSCTQQCLGTCEEVPCQRRTRRDNRMHGYSGGGQLVGSHSLKILGSRSTEGIGTRKTRLGRRNRGRPSDGRKTFPPLGSVEGGSIWGDEPSVLGAGSCNYSDSQASALPSDAELLQHGYHAGN
mmetsp:Transcript_3032/g.10790  ORF Transcript_3032/g.10790 Transcript_3032/m.10790 type:complete len:233 (+) Transcript_3032:534-1232(+)